MNREEAKQLLPIIQAFAEGKTIQYGSADGTHWADVEEPSFGARTDWKYRIKPEPKLRAWLWDECPKCFVAESKNPLAKKVQRVACKQVGFDHVRFMDLTGECMQARISFDELMRDWNRIAEDGAEHPCGIMETHP